MPFCPQCGANNPDGARFCQACGKPVPAATGGAAPPPPGPTGSIPPAPGAPPSGGPSGYGAPSPGYGAPGYPGSGYGAPVRRKNPTTAALLGLFWGFGAQAFYNGQPLKAVAQIVVNFLFVWKIVQGAAWSGGAGAAWGLGLAIAAIFIFDGHKVAQKINAGVPVGPWTFF